MNWIRLIRLFRTIYYGAPPDTDFIQRSGLLAVKIGQTYAQRADFLSESSCRELAKLYRKTNPVAPQEINQLIRSNTEPGWLDAFEKIEIDPFACASIGQVHRATLRSGEKVVVKLVRGEFRRSFELDVHSVMRLIRLVVRIYPKLGRVADPIGTLRYVESTTLSELDLRNEAQGQLELERIYCHYKERFNLSRLRFPSIYRDLSNEHVMVSELIEAPTFDELLECGELSFKTLLDLFEIHGFFLFCVGVFHGDIHPGNIILKGSEIYLLDTGTISRVPALMRKGLFRFFDALVVGDFERSARSLESMSRCSLGASRFKSFQMEFAELYKSALGKTVAEQSLTKQMMQTIRLAVDHGMDFETGMYPIVKSLMYLDGMVLRCAPQTDLLGELGPVLERFRPWVEEDSIVDEL
ncbi:AarF/ABC1/UbiB kinase family protein [bacterium]|jgi:ubiquinone biosynthesis protein|nr:AarF/ABC1/UbiB kinase family protein [bacterium]MDA7633150.1 AarF/ABC1/UbiB kinase family protein [bacterium]MDB4745824.1 AarF/ABC1/UbiB kinase family protein [Verrucomicrobiota bacterium]MDB4798307.1 AarF/ABC1/UbiB kinase family protein [Verrucomicrobiota bacterium]